MIHYNLSLADLENMIPWEFESYVGLLQNHLQKLAQAKQNQK